MLLACRVPFMDAVKGTKVKTNLKGDMEVDIPAGEHCPMHANTDILLSTGGSDADVSSMVCVRAFRTDV